MVPITFTNLVKRFGQTTAVDSINLTIPAGSLFFLLGPSGCGKTTLLRMLAGFSEPTSGTIKFGEQDVTDLPANKRNCGMVFQSYALWPHMTVRQNVAFGLEIRKVGKADITRRVDAALESVQMSKYAERKPNQLSGGQQQRVALGRALVIEPTVLLLDEPLSNLDAKLRLEMRSSIRHICKAAKITAVYVTHDQKEALSMADGMAVLRDGKVIQTGQPRAMYDRPATKFVADFLGETNFVPATVTGVQGDAMLLDTPAGKVRSTKFPSPTPAVGTKVTLSIRPEAIAVHDTPSDDAARNVFVAKRIDVTYLGEVAQHQLLAGGDTPIKSFELNPRLLQGDAAITATFSPNDVVVLLN
jgi:iron(III) transport system ATP-binding protein